MGVEVKMETPYDEGKIILTEAICFFCNYNVPGMGPNHFKGDWTQYFNKHDLALEQIVLPNSETCANTEAPTKELQA